jgi:GTP-dependent phosphoenolpyruvate carboxykinase
MWPLHHEAIEEGQNIASCNTCYGGWAILHFRLTSVRPATRGLMDTGWSFDGSFTTESRNYLFHTFSNGPF